MAWSSFAEVAGVREIPLFFGAPGRRKFAIVHEPPGDTLPAPPLVLCHPHFEEKLWAHRVLVDLARRVAAAGHVVVRFDLSGHGDSEGEFEEFGFEDLERDVVEATEWTEGRTGRKPVLAGLRLGGTLAGRAAARLGLPAVLWEPVVDVASWLRECLRINLTFQVRLHGRVQRNRDALVQGLLRDEAVVIEGYGLTGRFWREATASGGLGDGAFPGSCPEALVVELRKGSADAATPVKALADRGGPRTRIAYRRFDEEPFWNDVRRYRTASPDAAEATVRWLDELGRLR
ncbi:MAG TPA: CocE/NonD family hydrolase [Candidatus Polarisedimenticolaceae bacterium]